MSFAKRLDSTIGIRIMNQLQRFLADRFNKASCLFCRNSIKCETSSVKRDCPLSDVLLPITINDLIGNWKFKYYHTTDLSPHVVVT